MGGSSTQVKHCKPAEFRCRWTSAVRPPIVTSLVFSGCYMSGQVNVQSLNPTQCLTAAVISCAPRRRESMLCPGGLSMGLGIRVLLLLFVALQNATR